MIALALQFDKRAGRDGLDFRDNVIRLFPLDDLPESLAVEHRDDVRAVGHLHGGSVGVLVEGDDLHAIALQLDHKLFSQFARAAQDDFRGGF